MRASHTTIYIAMSVAILSFVGLLVLIFYKNNPTHSNAKVTTTSEISGLQLEFTDPKGLENYLKQMGMFKKNAVQLYKDKVTVKRVVFNISKVIQPEPELVDRYGTADFAFGQAYFGVDQKMIINIYIDPSYLQKIGNSNASKIMGGYLFYFLYSKINGIPNGVVAHDRLVNQFQQTNFFKLQTP